MYFSIVFLTSFWFTKEWHILKMYLGLSKESIFWLFPENLHDIQKQPNHLSFAFCRKKKKKKWINFLSTYSTVLNQFYLFNKYLIITYNFKKSILLFGLIEKMDRTSQKADPSISEIIQAGSIWEAFSLIARTGQSAIVWTHRADITDTGQERNNPCPVVLGDNSISRTSVLIYLSIPDIWSSWTPVTQSSRSGFLLPNDQFGWGQGALWLCTLAMPIFSNLGFLPTPISTALPGSSIPFTLSGKS